MRKIKRSLINLVFTYLTLNEGKLSTKYTKTFNLLAEAVKLTNRSKIPDEDNLKENIFEPKERLTKWDDFRHVDWVAEIEFPEITLKQTQELLLIPV